MSARRVDWFSFTVTWLTASQSLLAGFSKSTTAAGSPLVVPSGLLTGTVTHANCPVLTIGKDPNPYFWETLLLWSAFLHLHQPVALTILDLLSTHLSAGLCTRAAISGRMATSGGDVAFSLLALLRPVRRCHPIHLSVRGEPCSGSRSCRCSA